jgi:hypothetical protein
MATGLGEELNVRQVISEAKVRSSIDAASGSSLKTEY